MRPIPSRAVSESQFPPGRQDGRRTHGRGALALGRMRAETQFGRWTAGATVKRRPGKNHKLALLGWALDTNFRIKSKKINTFAVNMHIVLPIIPTGKGKKSLQKMRASRRPGSSNPSFRYEKNSKKHLFVFQALRSLPSDDPRDEGPAPHSGWSPSWTLVSSRGMIFGGRYGSGSVGPSSGRRWSEDQIISRQQKRLTADMHHERIIVCG